MRIDEDQRKKLNTNYSTEEKKIKENIKIKKAGILGKFVYCLTHSNPIVKYPSWIALILGSISILIGLLPYLSKIISCILNLK